MKVKELIKLLTEADQELNVRLVTDHGQTPMTCTGYGDGYISEDSYMPDEVDPDDVCDDSVKVLILEGF